MDVCLLILNNKVFGLSSVRLEMKHDDIYQKFFAMNPTPMWISDRETQRFLVVNDAAVRNYGYSREEFLGLTLKDIRPAEDIPGLADEIIQAGEEPESTGVRRQMKKNGDLIFVDMITCPVEHEGRPGELVMSIDVTARICFSSGTMARQWTTPTSGVPRGSAARSRIAREHRWKRSAGH
jgi:PAS domain S-box-containing protein